MNKTKHTICQVYTNQKLEGSSGTNNIYQNTTKKIQPP